MPKQLLYESYRHVLPGGSSPTLRDYHFDGGNSNIFDTRQIEVFDGDELVAFSFFDIGKTSAASIQGVYATDYAKHSLGFYTMLLEISYCMEKGMDFYYPGYVVPGYDRFDYKLRIGDCQFFDLTDRSWKPYRQFSREQNPSQKLIKKMFEASRYLKTCGLQNEIIFNPNSPDEAPFPLSYHWQTPLQVVCTVNEQEPLIIEYDLEAKMYHLNSLSLGSRTVYEHGLLSQIVKAIKVYLGLYDLKMA